MTRNKIYHGFSDCPENTPTRTFLQIRPYYDGGECLMEIEVCTRCGAWCENEYKGEEHEQEE